MSKLEELVALAESITQKLEGAIKDDLNFGGLISDKLFVYAQQMKRLKNDLYQVKLYAEG